MSILAIGVNHTTAAVSIREQVAFQPEDLKAALQSLVQQPGVSESVILSTCNRTELYCYANEQSVQAILKWLAAFHNLPEEAIKTHVFSHCNEQAVSHIMAVAAGLDSLVLGEPQILGQVKDAYENAREVGTVGTIFERLFQSTFSAAKAVRTETKIGEHAVSVAYSAVQLAKHIFPSLEQAEVLLVGAGETAELAARHLKEQGVKTIKVANRTVERAQGLAEQIGGEAHTLTHLKSLLPTADIVISSTASPIPVIGKGWVESAIKARRHKPMLFIDLAVPRDIEEEVGELADVYLYTVDDLQKIVSENRQQREQAALEANVLIGYHCEQFKAWVQGLQSLDVLKSYRNMSQQTAEAEQTRAIKAIQRGVDPEKVIRELTHRLTNKLIHKPTVEILRAGRENDLNTLAAYKNLIHYEAKN